MPAVSCAVSIELCFDLFLLQISNATSASESFCNSFPDQRSCGGLVVPFLPPFTPFFLLHFSVNFLLTFPLQTLVVDLLRDRTPFCRG